MNIGTINIKKEGQLRFVNFVRIVSDLIKDNKIDHLVVGGNSGISLSEITLMIYDLIGCKVPHILRVPFYRYYPQHRDDEKYKFDPQFYKPQISNYVKETGQGTNYLFVDDEIYKGNTALGIKRLLEECLQENNFNRIRKFYIVAEDQGFKIPNEMSEIDFKSIATEIDGYNNLIFTFIPTEFEQPLIDYFGNDEKLAFRIRANLLLNLPVKDFNNGKPVYSFELLNEAKQNIKYFEIIQEQFRSYMKEEITKILF